MVGAAVAGAATFVSYLLNTGQISLPSILAMTLFVIQAPAGLLSGTLAGNLHQPNVPLAYCLVLLTYFGIYVVVLAAIKRLRER